MGGMQVWGSHLSVMPRPREKNKARKGEGAGERAIGPVDECEGCKGLGGDKIMGRGGWVGGWGPGGASPWIVKADLDGILALRGNVEVRVDGAG